MTFELGAIAIEKRITDIEKRSKEYSEIIGKVERGHPAIIKAVLIPELVRTTQAPYTTSEVDADVQDAALASIYRILSLLLDLERRTSQSQVTQGEDLALMFMQKAKWFAELENIYEDVRRISTNEKLSEQKKDAAIFSLLESKVENGLRALPDEEDHKFATLLASNPSIDSDYNFLATETDIRYLYLNNRVILSQIRDYVIRHQPEITGSSQILTSIDKLRQQDREYHQAVLALEKKIFANLKNPPSSIVPNLITRSLSSLQEELLEIHTGYKEAMADLERKLRRVQHLAHRKELKKYQFSSVANLEAATWWSVVREILSLPFLYLGVMTPIMVPLLIITLRHRLLLTEPQIIDRFMVIGIFLLPFLVLHAFTTLWFFKPLRLKHLKMRLLLKLVLTWLAEITLLLAAPLVLSHSTGAFHEINPFEYEKLSRSDRVDMAAMVFFAICLRTLFFVIQAATVHREYQFSLLQLAHYGKFYGMIRNSLLVVLFIWLIGFALIHSGYKVNGLKEIRMVFAEVLGWLTYSIVGRPLSSYPAQNSTPSPAASVA